MYVISTYIGVVVYWYYSSVILSVWELVLLSHGVIRVFGLVYMYLSSGIKQGPGKQTPQMKDVKGVQDAKRMFFAENEGIWRWVVHGIF